MNKSFNFSNAVFFSFLALTVFPAMAGGGLDSATDALTNIKTWLFTFTGVGALVYMLYNVIMALAERKQWSDVGMALVYCAIAGGAVAGGTWALDIFK